ncbi:MAG: hypothetical protein Kow0099_17190 [Candidatus Abyssubacteria bacterium]
MEYYELGIFFDLSRTHGRGYVVEAWEAFTKYCDPLMLKDSQLFHGEVPGLLPGLEHLYCISVRTPDLKTIQYLKLVFAACEDKRLASPLDRIRESGISKERALKLKGEVDSDGRLVTEQWSRTDHDLCKNAGWAYRPRSIPRGLSTELLDELDRLGERTIPAEQTYNPPPLLKPSPRELLESVFSSVRRRLRSVASVAAAVAVALTLWFSGDRMDDWMAKGKTAILTRLTLGGKACEKRKQGFAMAAIARVPHELDLDMLNERLESKGYYVVHSLNDSFIDAWVNCSVWFSTNEVHDPLKETVTQAFLKMDLKSVDGTLLWTCTSRGVRVAPGEEDENLHLREKSLKAAIESMDLDCLPDGKSVRSFLVNNDFGGLKSYVASLSGASLSKEIKMTRHEEMSQKSTPRASPPIQDNSKSREMLFKQDLKTNLQKHLADEWIMTHRLTLATGAERDVIVLEENPINVRVRLDRGVAMFSRSQIQNLEPLTQAEIAQDIQEKLIPFTKEFSEEWQRTARDELISEMSYRCITYGPPFPGACVEHLKVDPQTGKKVAYVETAQGTKLLRKGQRFSGFNVIAIDPETNTVLLQMGEGGAIFRIWPKASIEER